MAKNRAFAAGINLSLPVPEGTVSGNLVIIGQIAGVALINRLADGTAEVATRGVYELKAKGVNKAGNVKIEIGDKLYSKSGVLGKNNEEGVFVGYALEEVVSGAEATILVRLGT
jgi:predicted RecA/RadA family phage recombinase